MAAPKTWTLVVEADFYDQQKGLRVGVQMEEIPDGSVNQLLVTRLSVPTSVWLSQSLSAPSS